MKELNIARMLVEKRREKGITQDELAAYIGVSKASVSKWETEQSYPDITFLPQLAAYFNISIDALIGYEPQMTKEDIKKLYQKLSLEFAEKPFQQVYDECHEITRKYFSCFPLLLQIATLYLNHYMLSEDEQERNQVLNEAIKLCQRVKNESDEVRTSKDAELLEAVIYLYSQKPTKTLEVLGETLHQIQPEMEIIAQAYQMLGNNESALEALQVSIYQHLISIMASTPQLLSLNIGNPDMISEILYRSMGIGRIFQLDKLHPSTMATIYLTAAQVYATNNDEVKTLEYLKLYANIASEFFPCTLHGDAYFDKIDTWISDFALGNSAPRNEQIIKSSFLKGVVENPAFLPLKDNANYQAIVQQLKDVLGGN